MTTDIKPLSFEPETSNPGLEIRERRNFGAARGPLKFQVTLWGDGFEATHTLALEDLRTIRDWLNDTIQAHQKIASAEAAG